ncbi:SET domain-containing protein, partial [Glonium stellatum]
CLFTNTHFRFGRGISFVTTPEIAIEITRSYEFSDYERLPPSEPPPYRAEELLGRGIGLLANRTIKSGETVMGNPPVIVLMQKALDTLEREQRYALLHKAVGQLPEQTQTQIRALAKSRGGDEIGDIVQTNSIGQSYGKGVRHLSIVPEAARINHDCRPNSFYRFDDKDLTLQVFALRNIEAGEEISFNYAGAEFPRDARHSYLQAHWGFTCACSLCTASHQAIAASDSRLNEISNIKAQLRNTPPRSTASLHEILSLVQKLIELYDEERLIVPKAPYYEIAAYTCSQLGNKTCVQRNAELAADHWRVLAGEKSWEVTRMLGLGGNPKAHPSWR